MQPLPTNPSTPTLPEIPVFSNMVRLYENNLICCLLLIWVKNICREIITEKGRIMTYLPIAILSINFCCFLLDPFFLSNKNFKARFLKMPVFFQKLFVFIVVGPLFIAPVIPQSRFNISNVLSLPIGISLFILGWIIIIFAFFRIGVIPSLRKKSNLITSGIYSVIRHPIYSGTLISVLGWNILFKSIISMIYFPLLCLFYLIETILEEKGLIEEYGDQYLDYKKKVTKRLIPFIF